VERETQGGVRVEIERERVCVRVTEKGGGDWMFFVLQSRGQTKSWMPLNQIDEQAQVTVGSLNFQSVLSKHGIMSKINQYSLF
jgi:hypothetical protein